MIINDDVIASIDENLVDISSGWLWSDVDVYSPDYTSKLAQPISVESSTLNELRFLTSAGNIIIRNNKTSHSKVLWAGYIEFINDPTEISINQKLDTSALNFSMSTGVILNDIPDLIRYTDGFSVPGFDISIYPTTDFRQTIEQHTITSASFTIARDGVSNYVVVDYNNGNPYLRIERNTSIINQSNIVAVYAVWNIDGYIHAIGFDNKGQGLSNKIDSMIIRTEPYKRSIDGGLIISNSGYNILLTSAIVYAGTTPYDIKAYNSSVDYITKCYHTAGNWSYNRTSGSSVDNIYYDNGTNLVSANNNKYLVRWIYRSIGDDKEVFLVYGTNQYNTLALAQLESIPSVPGIVQSHCMLVGRFIVQQGSTSIVVESSFAQQFSTSTVGNHNDLNNIQGGNSTNSEYYHLSANTYNYLQTVSADVQTQINDMDNKFQTFADGTYLRLDASNSPITNTLRMNGDIIMSSATGGKKIIFQDEAVSPGTSAYISTGLGSDYPFALRVLHSSASEQTALHVMSPNNNTSATRIEALVPTLATNISAINFSDITYSGNKVLVSNSNFIKESTVTTTELGYLTGVSANIQSQLNELSATRTSNGYWIEQFRQIGWTDQQMFDAAKSQLPSGAVLYFSPSATYILTSQVVFPKSITIEGNYATISGTGSLIGCLNNTSSLTAGPYGTTSAGECEITLSTGLSILPGDILMLESDTLRVEYGNYKWGQCVLVKSYTSGTGQLLIAQPAIGTFTINRIKIYSGVDCVINNIIFDNSSAIATPASTGFAFRGFRLAINNCKFVGGLNAAQGVDAIGHMIRITNSRAYGYINYYGSSGSRLGYGFNVVGDDCVVLDCNGERNKHSVDSASRTIVTRNFSVVGGTYTTPKSQVSSMAMSGTDPLYQYQVGTHANVYNFNVQNVTFDGINSLAGTRSGQANVTDCTFYSRDTQSNDRVNNIFLIAESPVTNISITNCNVFVDPGPKTSQTVFIGGLEYIGGTHKNINLSNIYIDGGMFFRMPGTTSVGVNSAATSNLDGLSISNINGSVSRFLEIGNTTNTKIQNISNVYINNVHVSATSGAGASTISYMLGITLVSGVDNINLNNVNFYHRQHTQNTQAINIDTSQYLKNITINNTNIISRYGGIRLKSTTLDNIEITNSVINDNSFTSGVHRAIWLESDFFGNVNFDNVKILSDYSGIYCDVTSAVIDENISKFNDIDIKYNMLSGLTNIQGIKFGCTTSWQKPFYITNTKVSAVNALSDSISQPIRFNSKCNAIFDNVTTNADWYVVNTYDLTPTPIGCGMFNRNRLSWKGNSVVDYQGNLYLSAAPTSNLWYVGERTRNIAPTSASKGWICTVSGTPGTHIAE